MAEKNNRALGRGIGALFKKEKREEPKIELEPEAGNFEFYGSLMKKYIQSGSKDPMIAQLLEEIREHLCISPEEHVHMMETLRKREEARQVWADKENWEKEHGGLQTELKDMFKSYTSNSNKGACKDDDSRTVIEGTGAIALMERNPTILSEGSEHVISVPPHIEDDNQERAADGSASIGPTVGSEARGNVPIEELPELDDIIEEIEGIESDVEDHRPTVEGFPFKESPESTSKVINAPKETIMDLRSLMESGDMEAALDMVHRLLDSDPYSPTLLNEKGVLFYNMGRTEESLECYRRALALEPDSPELNINYALVLSMKGEMDESIEHLDRAIEKNPYNEEAWNNKAVILTQKGRLRDALNCLDESLRINERSPTAWHNTAVILERMGDYRTALECYSRVVDLDPMNGAALEGLDHCRGRLGSSN